MNAESAMDPKLAICCATMSPQSHFYPGDIPLWTALQRGLPIIPVHVQHNTIEDNLGVVGSYQYLYERSHEDLLAFVHDDVIMREEGWNERVIGAFRDESVGLLGFGGALIHGASDIYKTPYRLQQLGRDGYRSNVDDAEVHGERFTGSCDVAVLDGFCLIVRRAVLDLIGGWSSIARGADFFCYDYALCALVHRLGYRVALIGVRCQHRGGVTSVKEKKLAITSQEAYDRSHRWFYENFADVLPWRCNGS